MGEFVHVYNDGGGIRDVSIRDGISRIFPDRTLWQSGVPFVIFGGDGGSNGFSFSGTRAVFTLSAAVLTNFWVMLQTGGYAYLPAGAGGIATAGWYFVRMTDDTNGEIFQDTYSGVGQPIIPASPTPFSNRTSGRITQTTSEVTACSFIMPGGCLGPNGIITGQFAFRASSNSNAKKIRSYIGTSANPLLTYFIQTNSVCDLQVTRQNCGSLSSQIGTDISNAQRDGNHTTAMGTSSRSTIDTTVDNVCTFVLQIAVNTETVLGIMRQVIVQHGA
jgi:hypothetical protein